MTIKLNINISCNYSMLSMAAVVVLWISVFFVLSLHCKEITPQEYALISADSLEISSSCVVYGNIYTNNTLRILDDAQIQGQVFYGGRTEISDITNLSSQPQQLSSPGFTPNYDISKYITINKSMELEYTKLNGCFFVTGDVVIAGQFRGRISIVATGNITVTGDVDIRPVNNMPVLFTENGEISVSCGGEIQGLLYARKISVSGTAKLSADRIPGDHKEETRLFMQSMGITLVDSTDGTAKKIHSRKQRQALKNTLSDIYYNLPAGAICKVNVLNQEHETVYQCVINSDNNAPAKRKKRVKLWDRKNSAGKEIPGGIYYILLVIDYLDGSKDTKTFLIEKGK